MKYYLIYICVALLTVLHGQEAAPRHNSTPHFAFKNGLGFATPDSSYSLNLRFRMQNRALMNTTSNADLTPASWEARVRRCRLVLAGHVLNPKLTYYLQLSFSRGDMDWSVTDPTTNNTSPNVVRDAIVFYRPSKNLLLGFGQAKLPGNRQRINSSGALQFYDRSIVNAVFTPDRDFGVFMNYTGHITNHFLVVPKLAITSGEGRNSVASNAGLCYTARVEVLPFGNFADNGDFFEGDVLREKTPKLSVAGGYELNDMAVRSGGQLGKDLYGAKTYNLYFADLVFKYSGFAFTSEYMRRDTDGPPTVLGSDGKLRSMVTGDGVNVQLSYCSKSAWEIAGRYSLVSPHRDVLATVPQNEQYGLGLSKYLNGHKVKLQANVFYNTERNLALQRDQNQYFFAVFQMELGI